MNTIIKNKKSVSHGKYGAKQMFFLLILSLVSLQYAVAQVMVPFTQRTSTYSPDKKTYNIKGDFQLIGNTNLTLVDYAVDGNSSSNDNDMKYVDVDEDANTLNSSSATLQLSTENGANPDCSNIIYAGLYWTGRAHNGTSENIWQSSSTDNRYDNNTFNGYNLDITASNDNSQGGSNGRVATYTFTPSDGSAVIVFHFYSWRTGNNQNNYVYNGSVTVQVGSASAITLNGSITSNSTDNYTYTFSIPYVISSGSQGIQINSLRKRRTDNGINDNYRANITSNIKTFDKSIVKLKHESALNYTTISANDVNFSQNIYYPTTSEGYMYSAYAEITDYVKEHRTGSYTVADIALREGDGGGTGYYGGWGIIVVYENDLMKWRDVTIFDGHAYIVGGDATNNLPISGFNAVQSGDVNLKLGIIAGEGDRNISGDFFEIQKRNTNTFERLSHRSNSTTNFFNSSINTGNNPRNPNLVNNTGLDIAMFNINNEGNTVIDNNQTSTTFRYGSTQDTYIIPMIAMAVDAYVPDVECSNTLLSVGGIPYNSSITSVQPNQAMQYKLEIKNNGSEAVEDLVIIIPLPFTGEYGSYSANASYTTNVSGTVSYNPALGATGSIVWNIGNLPLEDGVLATLNYSFKVTTDCDILSNANCVKMTVGGTSSGRGAVSGTTFTEQKFICGYNTEGNCVGTPIYTPVSLDIDADNYRLANCPEITDHIIKLYYCGIRETSLSFNEIASHFPNGASFYNAIEFYDDEELELTGLVRSSNGATHYTSNTGFPNNPGTKTYYAIAPASNTSCYWQFTITVEVICNLWHGTVNTNWDTKENWINNRIPATGEDVEFATQENNPGIGTNKGAAVRDLYVPVGMEKKIGSLINLSEKAIVIPAGTGILINEEVIGSETNPNKIVIKADNPTLYSDPEANNDIKPNGSFIVKNGCGKTIMSTVELYAKGYQGTQQSWTDNIVGSPTNGTTFTNSYRWQYFGVPVETVIASPTFDGANIRKYDETKNSTNSFYNKWIDLENADILNAFAGYEITQKNPTIYTIQGKLNLCEKNVILTRQAPAVTGASGVNQNYALGQNIFGNSFTAAIPIFNIVFANNVENTVYLYNTGTFSAWGNETGNQPGSTVYSNAVDAGNYRAIPKNTAVELDYTNIPSMQGFLLKHNGTTGTTITQPLPYAGLTKNNNPQTAPKAPLSYLEVTLNSESTVDKLWLFSHEGTSPAFDDGWDGMKFFGTPTAFIYTPTPAGHMQVSTTDNIVGSYIDFVANTEKNYTLTIRKSNIDRQQYPELYLVDLKTKEIVPLTDETTEYTFTADNAGTNERRFRIKSVATTGTEDMEQLYATVRDGQLYLMNNSTSQTAFRLYDAAGRLVDDHSIPAMSSETVTRKLPIGVYVINMISDSENYKEKIIISNK